MERLPAAMKVLVKGLLPACLLLGAVAGRGEVVDRIVAIVNEDVITLSELSEAAEPYARKIGDAFYEPEEERRMLFKVREEILNKMIDQTLTNQESKRLGISVLESEVEQRLEKIKSDKFLTEEDLQQALAAEGYTLEEYRKKMKEQMLRIKLINVEVKSKIAITEEEIRGDYDKHKETYQEKNKYHLRTILFRVPDLATAEEKEGTLKRMRAIVEALKAGAAFDELARQYSDDITAKEGGDLGLFSLEELSSQFRETVRWMKAGEVSPVLETPQGYQLLMLQEIQHTPGKTFQEAKIEIEERLFRKLVDEKYAEWLQGLRKRSYIKVIQ
ncbi:MAG: peptidylprolyl isomerase [Deltaproteobacteria bacterium]